MKIEMEAVHAAIRRLSQRSDDEDDNPEYRERVRSRILLGKACPLPPYFLQRVIKKEAPLDNTAKLADI